MDHEKETSLYLALLVWNGAPWWRAPIKAPVMLRVTPNTATPAPRGTQGATMTEQFIHIKTLSIIHLLIAQEKMH